MKHAYLTKDEIDRSYRLGAITLREVEELLTRLYGRTTNVVQNKIVHHDSTRLSKVA